MQISHAALASLYVAFSAAFRGGLQAAETQYQDIAMTVPSTTRSNEYGWLGEIPEMREWIGDRVIHGLKSHGYAIRNKSFELTVGVDRDDIEDDNLGIYTPVFTSLGDSAAAHPDKLTFGLLAAGASTPCYDGQNFFDTDHPVLDENGVEQSQSNWDNNGGSGTPWYVMDLSKPIKPLIFQERKKPKFVAMTQETDHNVFHAKRYEYGVDSRCNVGVGLWQLAQGSRVTLDATSLQAAITALESRKGDHGRPLALKTTHLVVPPSLRWKAAELLTNARLENGADNVLYNAAKPLVARRL